jgi:hypothetical protein
MSKSVMRIENKRDRPMVFCPSEGETASTTRIDGSTNMTRFLSVRKEVLMTDNTVFTLSPPISGLDRIHA